MKKPSDKPPKKFTIKFKAKYPEPKKHTTKKAKRKDGSIYKRKVLSERWKNWRNKEANLSKDLNKYYNERAKLAKDTKPGYKKSKSYKSGMTHVEFVDMRMDQRMKDRKSKLNKRQKEKQIVLNDANSPKAIKRAERDLKLAKDKRARFLLSQEHKDWMYFFPETKEERKKREKKFKN